MLQSCYFLEAEGKPSKHFVVFERSRLLPVIHSFMESKTLAFGGINNYISETPNTCLSKAASSLWVWTLFWNLLKIYGISYQKVSVFLFYIAIAVRGWRTPLVKRRLKPFFIGYESL
jgi:hypothetical protein